MRASCLWACGGLLGRPSVPMHPVGLGPPATSAFVDVDPVSRGNFALGAAESGANAMRCDAISAQRITVTFNVKKKKTDHCHFDQGFRDVVGRGHFFTVHSRRLDQRT